MRARAFSRLAVAENVKPSQLAGDISNALSTTLISLPVAGIAFCVWMWATVTLWQIRTLDPTGIQPSKVLEDSHKDRETILGAVLCGRRCLTPNADKQRGAR